MLTTRWKKKKKIEEESIVVYDDINDATTDEPVSDFCEGENQKENRLFRRGVKVKYIMIEKDELAELCTLEGEKV